MASLTVQCPECTLKLADVEHPDVEYVRDGDGNILCPNCKLPMHPIGAGTVLNAEEAFAHANRELANDAPLPTAETAETLTKRLREIESARGRVIAAQDRYEGKREAAKDAKKHLDEEMASFVSLVGRLSAVPAALPLFTQEAEAAAAPNAILDQMAANRDPEAVYAVLVDAGYLAVSVEAIEAWTLIQRDEARGWASLGGSVDTMPGFMQALMNDDEVEPREAETTA